MKTKLSFIAFHFSLLTLLFSCTDKPPITPDEDGMPLEGRGLVLNEGTWGGNNASISLMGDDGTIDNEWFQRLNGRGLGDVAQDLVLYHSTVYATVWGSNSLEVINTATSKAKHVSLGNRGPRYIAADGGKLYVSCYKPRSVVRIDCTTLEVEATCPLGDFNPEGLAIAGGKLFVASSAVADEQGNYSYDNKVYAIDLATFSDPVAIAVGSNPQKVMPLDEGRVVVNYWGNYGAEPAGSAVIDAATLEVTQTGSELTNMTVYNGNIYGYYTVWSPDYSSKTAHFLKLDGGSLAPTELTFPGLTESPYGINIDPATGDIYIATDGNYSANGKVFIYDHTLAPVANLTAGMLPSKVVFL